MRTRSSEANVRPSPPALVLTVWVWAVLAAGSDPNAFAQDGVVERNVNLRREPSTSNAPIRVLRPSEEFEILDPSRRSGYYHVETSLGEVGWLWSRNVSVDDEEPAPTIPAYDRDDWLHWIDADHDCQDTRNEVLIQESTVAVTFRDDRHCKVAAGRWVDPYGGQVITNPKQLDIDHLVPLANAHLAGAWAWNAERRRDYANELVESEHLIAVHRSLNRQKGAKGPEDWKPPSQAFWCDYAKAWKRTKDHWGLTMTTREAGVLSEMEATCP